MTNVQPPFPCPVCQSRSSRVITQETSPRGTVGIRQCDGCGLYFTYPRLDDPQSLYRTMTRDEWERKYGAMGRGETLHDRHQNYVEEAAIIGQYARGGRLLDVGCNAGWLLGYLQKAGGFTLEGLEPSAMLADIAHERLNVPIHNQYLADFDIDAGFDGIMATDVIEHILPEEVNAFVADMRRVLKVGGYAFIKTPNARFTRLKSTLSSALPVPVRATLLHASDVWDAKEHVIHWTAPTLQRIFIQQGFAIVRTFVPRMVETRNSPTAARLARRALYAAAQVAGGQRSVPFFAQDIFLVAQKQ